MRIRKIEMVVRRGLAAGACCLGFFVSTTEAALAQSSGGHGNTASTIITVQPVTPAPSGSVPRIETATVMVFDGATFPSQIKRSQGKFFLHIVNKTKHSSHSLVLESPVVAAAQVTGLGQVRIPRHENYRSELKKIVVPR